MENTELLNESGQMVASTDVTPDLATVVPQDITTPPELIPGEEAAPDISDDNVTSISATLMDLGVNLSEVAPNLYAPTDWLDEMGSQPLIHKAGEYLSRLSPLALKTPWVVTSGTRDLSGSPRTDSQDHQAGNAIDIAPMYSDGEMLPPDPPMMGLAWNIKSLILLSEGQWGDMPIFIEGDHIHFSSIIGCDQSGCLPIMWSDSDSYANMKDQAQDPILSKLRRSFWRWCTPNLELQPPSDKLMAIIKSLLGKQ